VVGQFFAAFPPQRSEDRRQRTEASRSGDRRAKTKTMRHASYTVLSGVRSRESGVRNQESANSHRRIIMRKILLVLVMTPWGSAAGGAWADVKATIADIERLPRGKRPAAYERGSGRHERCRGRARRVNSGVRKTHQSAVAGVREGPISVRRTELDRALAAGIRRRYARCGHPVGAPATGGRVARH